MDEASFPSDEDDGQLTGSDARVLIVDDEPEILRAFARMLRSFDVECAEGGREGLEVLKRSDAFDVVVLDLMMPDVDGEHVLDWMRENAPHLLSKVLLITAGAFTQRSRAFLSLWKGEVLEKPIAVSTLREKVKKVLQAQDMAVA